MKNDGPGTGDECDGESGGDVELIDKTRPFDGYFKVDCYRLRHRRFAGGMGPVITREIFERGHAACVLPYDAPRDRVILIEQFRVGPYAAGDPAPWMIEVVAGIIDAGETAEATVRREAMEEAGLAIGRLAPVGWHYMSPGGSSESMAFFIGEADSAEAGGLHGLAAEGEDIRVFHLAFAEALALVRNGDIRNAMGALALLQLADRRAELRARWSSGEAEGRPA